MQTTRNSFLNKQKKIITDKRNNDYDIIIIIIKYDDHKYKIDHTQYSY